MSNSICKILSHFKSLTKPNHNLFYLKYNPLTTSTAPKPLTKLPNQESFRVSYLINSCGLTPEKALSISKKVNFETPQKPDLVIASFKNLGFNNTQISNIVCQFPGILSSKPDKTILPKIQFFTSVGLSNTQITKLITGPPGVWRWNLEKKIVPTFNFLKNLLQCDEKTCVAISRMTMMCGHDFEARVIPNVKVLRDSRVSEPNIVALLSQQPNLVATKNDKFEKIVEEVLRMGFNPLKLKFVFAVHALGSMSKSTWENKVELLKKWGWSEDDIYVAFEKHPWFMISSEDKISAIMEFLINKSGLFEASDILRRPKILTMSLGKRIVPRCSVYQVLLEKGLVREKYKFTMLEYPEKRFLAKVAECCCKEGAPELLKLYHQKLELSIDSYR